MYRSAFIDGTSVDEIEIFYNYIITSNIEQSCFMLGVDCVSSAVDDYIGSSYKYSSACNIVPV